MADEKYYCGNCRESVMGDKIRKMAVGDNRNLVFCNYCNCFIKIIEPAKPTQSTK